MYCQVCKLPVSDDRHFRGETHALNMTLKCILAMMDTLIYYLPDRTNAIQELEGDIEDMFRWLASDESKAEFRNNP